MAGIRDQYGLTPKQRKFAENLADGMSQSDAYKFAYDATDMQGDTIRNKASGLAQRGDIRAAVDALVGERMRLMEVKGVSDRSKVIKLLRQFAEDDARPDHVRLRAVELWGKTCGAFIEVVDDRRERPSGAVAVELERRLGALLSAAAPRVTVIEQRLDDEDGDDDLLPLVASPRLAGSGVEDDEDDEARGLNEERDDALRETGTPR